MWERIDLQVSYVWDDHSCEERLTQTGRVSMRAICGICSKPSLTSVYACNQFCKTSCKKGCIVALFAGARTQTTGIQTLRTGILSSVAGACNALRADVDQSILVLAQPGGPTVRSIAVAQQVDVLEYESLVMHDRATPWSKPTFVCSYARV
jgi:hypothetical protein